MVFNSFTFVLFFLVFFPIYWGVNAKLSAKWRNVLLLSASYLFYGWWDWRFLSLIIISSLSDYFIANAIEGSQSKTRSKLLLGTTVAINLGILGFFKYFNFFIDSMNALLTNLHMVTSSLSLSIILPVGISFYTFQTMSYSIDVYRKKIRASQDPINFFAYVAFFPQLVAGPIERAAHLLPQFNQKKKFEYNNVTSGLRLTLWGLFKKLIIADNLSVVVDAAFSQSDYNAWVTLVGALAFAIQIYADFSGYSDMAIGLAKTLGFNLRDNFKTPYFSGSFQEFWTRWHISLSTWFRDYIYIPLGGSKGKPVRTITALLLTFLLSGLWHGAHINFVIWGLLHGLAVLLERSFKSVRSYRIYPFVVLVLTILFWIPFRAESTQQWLAMTGSLAHWSSHSNVAALFSTISVAKWYVLSPTVVVFFLLEYRYRKTHIATALASWPTWGRWTFYFGIAVLIIILVNLNIKPQFIYFQF